MHPSRLFILVPLVWLLAGCGGSNPIYRAAPTARCMQGNGATISAFSKRQGFAGGVAFDLQGYHAAVVFFGSHSEASRNLKAVRGTISDRVDASPKGQRSTLKSTLESRNYVSGNALVAWTSSKSEELPNRLHDLLKTCLEKSVKGAA